MKESSSHEQTSAPGLCPHIRPGPCPWETELVIDDHLGPTESLIACRTCGRAYLLEMLDWSGSLRLFRVRAPEGAAIALLTRDLNRGSCDLGRAREEVRHVSLASDRVAELLLYDTQAASLVERIALIDPGDVPWAGWRELACDGSRIAQLLAQTQR
ncbi:MAG: hypothetical protein AB7I04_13850 [Pseudomonadales bacterium]